MLAIHFVGQNARLALDFVPYGMIVIGKSNSWDGPTRDFGGFGLRAMRSVNLNGFCAVLVVLIIIGWLVVNFINIVYLVRRSRSGLRFSEVYWCICLMSLGVESEFYKKSP